MKLLYLSLLSASLVLTGCRLQPDQLAGPAIAAVDQNPFRLQLQLVPQRYLNLVHATGPDSTQQTTTFRLRVTSPLNRGTVGELFRQAAPAEWTTEQFQHVLHFQLDSVATLTVNHRRYPTVLATAETTVDTDREVNLLLVFPVPERVLRQSPLVQVSLTPTFFLTEPVSFTLPLADY